MNKLKLITALMLILLFTFVGGVFAEEGLNINWVEGPGTVPVGEDLAQLNLPEGYLFANSEDTKKIMTEIGNPLTNIEVGSVFPIDENQDWYVVFEFDKLGYIKDDDRADLDADKILESIKEGNEASNEERKKMNAATMDVLGWDEKPHYDLASNNLVWSVLFESEGEKVVNYNMRVLGRYGVTYVTMVASPEQVKMIKPQLANIISNFSYVDGKKYSDYQEGDEVAGFGLTALIAGGAGAVAAKAGVLAKILLIFKKLWIVVVVVILGFFKKIKNAIFGKKESSVSENE